jgi:hypothetical protein
MRAGAERERRAGTLDTDAALVSALRFISRVSGESRAGGVKYPAALRFATIATGSRSNRAMKPHFLPRPSSLKYQDPNASVTKVY